MQNPHENLTSTLPMRIPEDANRGIMDLAKSHGVNKTVYCRHVLAMRVYGAKVMAEFSPPSEPFFSRSMNSDAGGKCSDRLDITMTDDMFEKIIALAHANAFANKSEFARYVLECHVFGEIAMLTNISRSRASSIV